ncbi:MAG TPA: DUF2721 domain-containing protein [Gammaproteobacteria bacterium]|nr:DUF2721 domain-containing protein [Gammaproteobacteria bacterium]
MDLTLATPSLLFPAISLLLLAYTNRFLALASLIRDLHAKYRRTQSRNLLQQLANLRSRVLLIKYMQAAGAASLLLCVLCMFLLFGGWLVVAKYMFGVSLVLMMVSLALSVTEIWISVTAISLQLSDMEQDIMEHENT